MTTATKDVLKFVDGPVPVNVKRADGFEVMMVPARQHPMAPGLAVTMLNFGLFTTTHLPTGMAMHHGSEREGTAALRMACFAAIAKANGFTWDAITTIDAAKEKMKAISANSVPFEGATYTSSEGTKPMTIGEWFQVLRVGQMMPSDEFPWETASEHPLEQAVNLLESLRVQSQVPA